jgi:hypothetical protein
MPNYKLIYDTTDPLVVSNTPSYIYGANIGQVYDITTGTVDIAANGFLLTQLTIPANSGKTIYIVRLIGGSTVNTVLDIFRNATFSGGTAITPHNNNWNYSDASVCTAKFINSATDITSGGTQLITFVQTGGGTLLAFDGRLLIPSSTTDRQFYIRLKNSTNQTNTCSFSLAYWEK